MDVKQHFDQHAANWDEKPERVELAAQIGESLLNRVELNSAMEVLDFGCGTGLVSLPLAGRVKLLCGLDSSSGMLDVFVEKARSEGLANVQTLEVGPDFNEEVQGRYDLVVSSMVFHHIEDTDALLQKIYNVLKPGGWLYVADLDPDDGFFHSSPAGIFHNGFDRETLRRMWEKTGFYEISTTPAATVQKQGRNGEMRCFTIFLMGGRRG